SSEAFSSQIVADLLRIIALTIRDRQYYRLYRRKPNREFAFVVFDQDSEESLHRTQQRPVNHNRPMRLTVFADVFKTEPLWQIKVELYRRQLPQSTDSIDNFNIDFWTVKRSFTFHAFIRKTPSVQSRHQRSLCSFPVFVATHVFALIIGIAD